MTWREFPRSFDRGPIEAHLLSISTVTAPPFPRSFDRGPIEATCLPRRCPSPSSFPRSFDRGPIEAGGAPAGALPLEDFRDHLIAAPLKHCAAESLRPSVSRISAII